MTYTQKFTEGNAISVIPPASRNNATANGDWLSMRDYHRATALLLLGSVGASGTVNLKFQQAKDSAGSGAKDVPLKLLVELDAESDDDIAAIELQSEELDQAGKFDWIRAVLVAAGGAAVLSSVLVIRHEPRYAPVSVTNLAQVVS